MKETTVQLKNNVVLMPHIHEHTYVTMPVNGHRTLPIILSGEYMEPWM